MALSREYRVRELYLKSFEENFSRDRAARLIADLEECDSKLHTRFSKIGDLREKTAPEIFFLAYVYSLLDYLTLSRHHISPLKDLRRFEQHFAYSTSHRYPSNEDSVLEALAYCRLFDVLDNEATSRLAKAISLFQTFLNSLQELSLRSFSNQLKEFILYTVSGIAEAEEYQKNLRLYGQLLQTSVRNPESSVEAIRLALQCMPSTGQRSSNLFLYIIIRVYDFWPEVPKRSLHVPTDVDLRRVINRIGLTQTRPGNLEYGAVGYLAVQMLARRLASKDPAILYALKYVSKIWCRPRTTACERCPMNEVCSYAETVLLDDG